jgi:hypothetical protein
MPDRSSPSPDRPLPRLTRIGLATVGFGLLFDLSEHSFARASAGAGFSLGEHAAHLVVLLGMVAVLGGIVADGIRISRSRSMGPERSRSHALR